MERYLDRDRSAATIDKGVGNFLVVDYTAILLGFVGGSVLIAWKLIQLHVLR